MANINTAITQASLILQEILENAPEDVKNLDHSVREDLISIECRDFRHAQSVMGATWLNLLNAFEPTTLPYVIRDVVYFYGDGEALTYPLDV